MANLKEQVNDLTGFASTDDTALAQWFTDGAKEISNMFPPPLLHSFALNSSLTSVTPGTTDVYDMDNGKVLMVVRKNSSKNYPCREIPAAFSGFVADSSSLMYYATSTDPVYWIDNGTLKLSPTVDGEGATITALSYPVLVATGDGTDDITASGTTSIVNYPNEADYIVVLYASLRAIQRLMNDKSSSLPSDLVSPVLATVSTSLPSFTAPSDFVQPVSPIAPGTPSFTYTDASVTDIVQPILSISDKSALTTSAPTYTKPVFAEPSFPTFSALTVPSVVVVPPLSSSSVSFSQAAPTYTKPVFSAPTLSTIGSMTLPSVPVTPVTTAQTLSISGTAPTYTGPVVAPDFAQVDTYVDTDEDVELAGAKIQEINTQLQEFSSKIQDSIQVFNKENVEFQAKLNKDVQDVTMSDREEARKLQKYQQDVAKYSAEVNKEVQRFVNEDFNVKLQEWQIEYRQRVSTYQADIQNELNEFNKENAAYQVQLQISIQNSQLDSTDDSQKLQKYQAEVGSYQQEVNTNIQEWISEQYTPKVTEWQGKFTNRLQEYQANIQSELNEFNKENVSYQEDIGRKSENFNKEIQQAVQNAQNEISVKSANLTKEIQIALQNAVQDFQQDVQEYQAKVSKYQSEVNGYTSELQANGERFKNELAKNTASFQSDINKYQAETAKVSAENQGEVAKFTTQVQDFGARLQKIQTDYQWLQGQYQQLSGEYQRGVTMLRGQFQQPQQEERRR